MKTALIIADSGFVGQDGTFNLLRGGLTTFWGTIPYIYRIAIVLIAHVDADEAGQHPVTMKIMGPNGKELAMAVTGSITAPPGGGWINIVQPADLKLEQYGRHNLKVMIDGIKVEDYAFDFNERQPGN